MEEVHHEKVLDYLQSLKGLGPEQFLATYNHPFLLENYLAPSSRSKLGRVETISEVDVEDLLSPTDTSEKTAKAKKMLRQPMTDMIPAPISGAKAGTMVKTIIASDMILAISRPENRSRMIASPTTRGAANASRSGSRSARHGASARSTRMPTR